MFYNLNTKLQFTRGYSGFQYIDVQVQFIIGNSIFTTVGNASVAIRFFDDLKKIGNCDEWTSGVRGLQWKCSVAGLKKIRNSDRWT